VSQLYFIFNHLCLSWGNTHILKYDAALTLVGGAVFATAFVPRNAVGQEEPRFCSPMDIAIALDDTGSMGGAIANIVGSLPAIIDQAQAASGPDGLPDTADDDLRLGYTTFEDEVTITITGIFQDEPTNGLGDGDKSPDGAGVGTSTAEVRSDRSGTGDGRVYHIMFSADDGNGGSCTGEVLVTVPHDQDGAAAIDQGALFDSTVA
jgi:hypothetical protein